MDEDPYKDLFQTTPACLSDSAFFTEKNIKNEIEILDHLKNNLKDDGLVFSSRVVDAFHTSLKCHDINPLTVLAGVSGTGKTLLPFDMPR